MKIFYKSLIVFFLLELALYLLGSLINWSFITKEWSDISIFIFSLLSLIIGLVTGILTNELDNK